MDLRRTRTFVTVAELGSVSKAAIRLRIAQPGLSRQIGELEQQTGLKLFDRVARRLVLTGAGEQLLGDCRGLLAYASALEERAQLLPARRYRRAQSRGVTTGDRKCDVEIPAHLQGISKRAPRIPLRWK